MTRLRIALLLPAIVMLVPCPSLSRAQDTVTTHTVQMVMVHADLSHTLDAKKAKQGDPVTAKLLYEAKVPDGGAWPSNTVLSGHVDRVVASENKSDSLIQITFDKAVLKHGKTFPIKATIMDLRSVYSLTNPAEVGQPSAAQSVSSAGPRAMNGSMRDLNVGEAPAANPQPGHTPATEVSRDAQDQGNNSHGQSSNVRGITLQSSVQQPFSAIFRSSRKNVHISGGTGMDIAVGVLPAGSAAH